jgi:hypothetical protein
MEPERGEGFATVDSGFVDGVMLASADFCRLPLPGCVIGETRFVGVIIARWVEGVASLLLFAVEVELADVSLMSLIVR